MIKVYFESNNNCFFGYSYSKIKSQINECFDLAVIENNGCVKIGLFIELKFI